jgi:hypothetical protein
MGLVIFLERDSQVISLLALLCKTPSSIDSIEREKIVLLDLRSRKKEKKKEEKKNLKKEL